MSTATPPGARRIKSTAVAGAAFLVSLCLIGVLAAAVLGNGRERTQARERRDSAPLLTEDDIKSLDNYPESFTLADYHIALIRQAVISWDYAEAGAPAMDPEKPFGSISTRAAIARIARLDSTTDTKRLKAIYADVGHALQSFLWYGELEPGVYRVPHPLNGELSALDRRGARSKNSPEPKIIEFQFKEAHRRLLDRAVLRWTDWPRYFGADHMNPTPGIDPKRPYGDRTYFEIDMAEILGIPVKDEPSDPFTPQQAKELVTLHHEMRQALQVFVVKAGIQPGVYKRKY